MYPSFRLNAVTHDKLSSQTKVFNLKEVDYHLFIRVPDNVYKEYEMYQLDEVDSKVTRIIESSMIDHDRGNPWYRIIFDSLNKSIGLHTYKLCMVSTITNNTLNLYFGYVIQNDNPDRSYIYMNRG